MKLPKAIDNTGKTLVAQYEVKLQDGLECGGAYIKLLKDTPEFDANKFEDKFPYVISEQSVYEVLPFWNVD